MSTNWTSFENRLKICPKAWKWNFHWPSPSHHAELLIMDEPTSGLIQSYVQNFWDPSIFIQDENKSVFSQPILHRIWIKLLITSHWSMTGNHFEQNKRRTDGRVLSHKGQGHGWIIAYEQHNRHQEKCFRFWSTVVKQKIIHQDFRGFGYHWKTDLGRYHDFLHQKEGTICFILLKKIY